jgi:PAS domain S-box-containing protein
MTRRTTSKSLDTDNKRLQSLGLLLDNSQAIAFMGRIAAKHWPVEVVSGSVQVLLGYTPEDFMSGRFSWLDITHPEDRPRLEREVCKLLAAGCDEWFLEYRMVAKDRKTVWIQDHCRVVRNAKGKPTHFQALLTDVTACKTAQEQLRQAEQQFRQLAENIHEVFWLASADQSEVLYVSPAYDEIWGRSREEFLRNPFVWMESIHPEDRPRIQFEVAREAGKPFTHQYRILRPDGSIRWILARGFPVKDTPSKVSRIAGFAEDITVRKQAEDVLRIQRDLFVGLSNVRDLPTTLRLCLDTAKQISGMDCGGVYLGDDAGGVRLAQTVGVSDDFVEATKYYPLNSTNAHLVMEGKPIYVRHPDLQGEFNEVKRREGLHALAMIPIRYEGHIIGCMNMASRVQDDIPLPSRIALETIASAMGLLISRARTDETLLESEERFRLFMNNSPTIAWIKNEQGQYVYLSKTYEDQFSVRLEDWRGKTDAEVWPSEIAETYHRNDSNVLHAEHAIEALEETINADGNRRLWISCKFPFCDHAGSRFVGGIGLDITARKQVETELLEFRLAVEQSANGINISDINGVILYANPALETIYGYAPGELAGQNSQLLKAQPEISTRKATPKAERAGRWSGETTQKRKDGSLFEAWLTTSPIEKDGIRIGMLAIVEDITDRKRAGAALEQKNVALRELVEQMAMEKSRVRNNIAANIEEVIMPLLARLRLKGTSGKYIDLLEHHLRDIASSYSRDVVRKKRFQITPHEAEICDMIKAGMTSKEIAKLLDLSIQTIQRHRRNIRRRLNLTRKKKNLALFLAND